MLPPTIPRPSPPSINAPPACCSAVPAPPLMRRDEVLVNDLKVSYLYKLPASGESQYTFFLVHGAGQCAASFTLLAEILVRRNHAVFCPDLRGHGHTWQSDDDVTDLSIQILMADLRHFVKAILTDKYKALQASEVFLVGHSMGGALVAKTAPLIHDDGINIYGVAILDVCEELATAALRTSREFARRIPKSFDSEHEAIDWVSSHMINNRNSAILSVPSQLTSSGNQNAPLSVRWKVPLLPTEKFWSDWFRGMNSAFLSGPWANRILVTSGIHAVDSELAIAQMKGKIQIEVLAKCGHVVHEDQADAVADILLYAIDRQEKLRQILSERKNK